MEPLFPHVIRIHDNKGHPVSWCSVHVPRTKWDFHLEMDMDDPLSKETYVFSFADQDMAVQFALLYG
jgi:hypothetical protein